MDHFVKKISFVFWHFFTFVPQGLWRGPKSVRGGKIRLRGTIEVLVDERKDWGWWFGVRLGQVSWAFFLTKWSAVGIFHYYFEKMIFAIFDKVAVNVLNPSCYTHVAIFRMSGLTFVNTLKLWNMLSKLVFSLNTKILVLFITHSDYLNQKNCIEVNLSELLLKNYIKDNHLSQKNVHIEC